MIDKKKYFKGIIKFIEGNLENDINEECFS